MFWGIKMKKTEVMFFFDTEDFTSNKSADAIYSLAEILTSEKVVGHFAVVGLLARQLKAWQRNDVIKALKPHIIGTHTYGHSLHPDICEQSDFEDFDEAFKNVAEYEDSALCDIQSVLNPEKIMFACPPGNSKSYVAMYYYGEKNIPFYCDTVVTNNRNSRLFYCNQEHIGYTKSLESMFLNENSLVFDVDDFLERVSHEKDRVIIYTHPNMSVKKEFWDKLNYDKENLFEFGNWIDAPDRTKEETNAFYENFRALIQKIKSDSRFKITNLKEMYANQNDRVTVTASMMESIKTQLIKSFSPIENPSLSISDIFCAVTHFLCGKTQYIPDKVFGFLSMPYMIKKPCKISRESIIKAAKEIDTSTFLPTMIMVGNMPIGPADYLFAALEFLTTDKAEVDVFTKEQLNNISEFKDLESFQLKDTWVHTPELKDNYLSERLRLQCWTLRY